MTIVLYCSGGEDVIPAVSRYSYSRNGCQIRLRQDEVQIGDVVWLESIDPDWDGADLLPITRIEEAP